MAAHRTFAVQEIRCIGFASEARRFTMFAGWIMAFYGVRRRSWPGTMIALLGLGLAEGAMTIGEGELR